MAPAALVSCPAPFLHVQSRFCLSIYRGTWQEWQVGSWQVSGKDAQGCGQETFATYSESSATISSNMIAVVGREERHEPETWTQTLWGQPSLKRL